MVPQADAARVTLARASSVCRATSVTIFREGLADVRFVVICFLLLAACVDSFPGANVQLDLSPATPYEAPQGMAPVGGQVASNVHFTLYGIQSTDTVNRLFEVERFEIHSIVDPSSPCFIDASEHARYPGIHVTSYLQRLKQDTGISDLANPPANAKMSDLIDIATAEQRVANVTALSNGGIKVVTSASATTYPDTVSCSAPSGIPQPTCNDDASNARRLAACKAIWKQDPKLFEGTDRILTAPLNGETHGFVDGMNPINLAPVGGAQMFVDEALDDVDAFAIYVQTDGMDTPGDLLFYGTPAQPTRGVLHVHLTSPTSQSLTAEMAVFPNVGQDDVHF